MVIIEYFGPAREAIGAASERLDFLGTTVAEALLQACQDRPRLHRLLFAGDRLAPGVLISDNSGEQMLELTDPVRDGDRIVVVPPISGGA